LTPPRKSLGAEPTQKPRDPSLVDLAIKNGNLVTPSGILKAGVAIDNGKIVAIATNAHLPAASSVIDASGRYVMPGAIDPHVHLGTYTGSFEQDVKTETAAASAGGATTLMHYIMGKRSFDDVLPELNPVVEKNSAVDIAYHGAVCTNEQISKLGDYVRLGIISFKFFLNRPEYEWQGITHPDDGMIFEAFERIKGLGGVAAAHCENYEIARIIRKRAESQTANALEIWERSRPRFCEALSMSHAIAMAKITGVSLYVVHMSIGEGIDIATKARIDGADVYLETNCAYLALSKRNVELGILGKVAPPIREPEDREMLWEGIRSGAIDCVGTDHCAISKSKKIGNGSLWESPPGLPGIQERMPLLFSEGYHKRGIPLETIVKVTSSNPASIFGLANKGALAPGYDADIMIVDLKKREKVTSKILKGFTDYSLYEGWELRGWPVVTILRGNVVMQDGEIITKLGQGKVLRSSPIMKAAAQGLPSGREDDSLPRRI